MLENVNSRQDLNFAIFGVDNVFGGSGRAGDVCQLISRNNFSKTEGAFASGLEPHRFKIPAGTIDIPGCGSPCPAYTPNPSFNILSHSCTSSENAPGTPCNVECAAGMSRAGTPVSCVGGTSESEGTYDGQIWCTDQSVSPTACVDGDCPDLRVLVGSTITQVTGPGCGDLVVEGTVCSFSCSQSAGEFSQGNLVSTPDGSWNAINGAQCLPCTGPNGCAAFADLGNEDALQISNTPGHISVCLTGHNFDPVNDKVILVEGKDAVCGDATNAAVEGYFLTCNFDDSVCGSPDAKLLSCEGLPTGVVPSTGTVCVCDADAAGGCTNLSRKYSVQGPNFVLPTSAPTAAPTTYPTMFPTLLPTFPPSTLPSQSPTPVPSSSPTWLPSVSPTSFPTSWPTESPTSDPTVSPTRLPTPSPSRPPTESPTFSPTRSPSTQPTISPTAKPTRQPTVNPTQEPSHVPTPLPSFPPSVAPSNTPSRRPTGTPTEAPTLVPTIPPSPGPTPFLDIDLRNGNGNTLTTTPPETSSTTASSVDREAVHEGKGRKAKKSGKKGAQAKQPKAKKAKVAKLTSTDPVSGAGSRHSTGAVVAPLLIVVAVGIAAMIARRQRQRQIAIREVFFETDERSSLLHMA